MLPARHSPWREVLSELLTGFILEETSYVLPNGDTEETSLSSSVGSQQINTGAGSCSIDVPFKTREHP